jgi:nicotinate-nucleotide pyrophosphorylase (carboxylating)
MSSGTRAKTDLIHLSARLLPTAAVSESVQQWFVEDGLDRGDVTSNAIIETGQQAHGRITVREAMVVAGLEPLTRALAAPPLSGRVQLHPTVPDGAAVAAGDTIARIQGGYRSVLAAERTILNLLGRLCGVATLTRRYVDAVEGTSAVICDTRKTTPGLRLFEKYAVACGGGTLHRLGLHDAALFKDNHLAGLAANQLGPRLETACREVRQLRDLDFVEVEVDTLAQLDVVLSLEAGLVDIALLDNMPDADLVKAVARRNASGRSIQLEASGGIGFDRLKSVAATGVDRIAVGALTRAATMLDVGLDLGLNTEPAS